MSKFLSLSKVASSRFSTSLLPKPAQPAERFVPRIKQPAKLSSPPSFLLKFSEDIAPSIADYAALTKTKTDAVYVDLSAINPEELVTLLADEVVKERFFSDKEIEAQHFYFTSIADDENAIASLMNFIERNNANKAQSITFNNCTIGDVGAEAIARYIKENKINFNKIGFQNCNFNSAGIIKIAQAFEQNYCINDVFFSDVRIIDEDNRKLGTAGCERTNQEFIKSFRKNSAVVSDNLILPSFSEVTEIYERNIKVRDILQQYTRIALGPRFVKAALEILDAVKSGKMAKNGHDILKIFPSAEINLSDHLSVLDDLIYKFSPNFISHEERFSFAARLDSRRGRELIASLKDYEGRENWPALLQEKMSFSGVMLKSCQNKEELLEAGNELKNCCENIYGNKREINKYVNNCLKGEQIVWIVDPETNKALSMMHFAIEGKHLRLIEHKTKGNKEASAEHREICKKFMDHVNNGRLPVDLEELKKGAFSNEMPANIAKAILAIGFNPFNEGAERKAAIAMRNFITNPAIKENHEWLATNALPLILKSLDGQCELDFEIPFQHYVLDSLQNSAQALRGKDNPHRDYFVSSPGAVIIPLDSAKFFEEEFKVSSKRQ